VRAQLETCDVVLRLLAASVVHSVTLDKRGSREVALINAASLAYLLEQCQSLNSLTLIDQTLDENHCRVLGDHSRPGLEIELIRCKLTSAGTSTLAEVLGRNQGPTKLHFCFIDNSVLANGLRGNISRLKRFGRRISSNLEVCNREVLALAGALKENKGLVELYLNTGGFRENDETWDAICDSLKTHPTLEVLNLRSTFTYPSTAPAAPTVINSRIQALEDVMKVNISIHTIYVDSLYSEHEFFRVSGITYLETNRFRPRLLAVQKARPIAYRVKILGRALLASRIDANRLWMLLSGNAEVAFPPTTATATPAANLPTPAAADATSSESVVAISTSVVSTLTNTTTGLFLTATGAITTSAANLSAISPSSAFDPTVTAAATVAAPSAGQKRKECP
jgi:hypothetical protein